MSTVGAVVHFTLKCKEAQVQEETALLAATFSRPGFSCHGSGFRVLTLMVQATMSLCLHCQEIVLGEGQPTGSLA
jgi:hypothetical protein